MVAAATMLHKSGCPDLHLLTSQVQIHSLFVDNVIFSFYPGISLSIFNPSFSAKKNNSTELLMIVFYFAPCPVFNVIVVDKVSNRGLTLTPSSSSQVPRGKLRRL